ncbi:MAG: hypothetical protein KAJ48_09185 [Elusimicrobiales bacterium]|nr:hypothetical protein [Elusimicrobiales bacterium]
MPLSTGATWNNLTQGKKARASEVLENMAWGGEGHLYPHFSGTTADATYDIGSGITRFKKGFFSDVLMVDNVDLTEKNITKHWGSIRIVNTGSSVTLDSYGITGISTSTVTTAMITWAGPFDNSQYAIFVNAKDGKTIVIDTITTAYCEISAASTLGVFFITALGEG